MDTLTWHRPLQVYCIGFVRPYKFGAVLLLLATIYVLLVIRNSILCCPCTVPYSKYSMQTVSNKVAPEFIGTGSMSGNALTGGLPHAAKSGTVWLDIPVLCRDWRIVDCSTVPVYCMCRTPVQYDIMLIRRLKIILQWLRVLLEYGAVQYTFHFILKMCSTCTVSYHTLQDCTINGKSWCPTFTTVQYQVMVRIGWYSTVLYRTRNVKCQH